MFLFFSKIGLLFITPFNWIIALIAWRLISKSSTVKRRLNVALIILIIFFGNEYIYNKLANAWQTKPVVIPAGKQYEAGIVLGGFVSFDKNGNGFLSSASDRLIAITALYKTGKIKKIVISAGTIEDDKPKEADYTYTRMLELGIPSADLVIENQSRNTFENAMYSRKKFDSLKLSPPYVLVTSAMHMPRALKVFAKARLPVVPYPCNYVVVDKKFHAMEFIIPQAHIIMNWTSFIKEVVGLKVYQLFNKA